MNATAANTTSPIEQEVLRIRALQSAHRFEEALAAAQALEPQVPENRDVLLSIALSQRFLQRIADALATLERLEKVDPGFSRLYQERGQCHVALKQAEPAIEAFLRAVNINPALPASWTMLEGLYRLTGRPQDAANAAAHVATLRRLPPEVVTATSLFSDGELAAAEKIVREFLLRHGDHIEAMRLLARIGRAHEVLNDAEILLEAVLKLAPDYQAARIDYAQVLLDRHKYGLAQAQLELVLKSDPGNRLVRTLHATACVGLGEHEKAIGLYRSLLVDAPRAADVHLSIAHALKTTRPAR